jgi:Ca-activated chloride channel homolog
MAARFSFWVAADGYIVSGVAPVTSPMRRPWIVCSLLVLALIAHARRIDSQTNHAADQSAAPYSLKVSVDEVSLTFHAADAHGFPVNDLKLDELSLLDNGRPPRGILDFQQPRELPIRAGILMDMSESMGESGPGDRAIAIQYAQRLLRRQTDQAFVIKFDRLPQLVQPWTNDPAVLTAGIRNHMHLDGGTTHLDGTAIFDAIYRACLNQFGHVDSAASGNFILLFSDGEDNASRTSLAEAVDMCQHTNTSIYAFLPESQGSFSDGPKTLRELASESGGQVFHDDDSEAQIYKDLSEIEANRLSQYRLIYRPAELKRDGSFHRIDLNASERVNSIVVRSGYYAPVR